MIITFILVMPEVNAAEKTDEFFTAEVGIVAQLRDFDFDYHPLGVTQMGYARQRDNIYLHIFWGSLIGDEKWGLSDEEDSHRTPYIFGEFGYTDEFEFNSDYFWSLSIGIGRVMDISDENKYFTSNNMYTQALTIAYDRYYLSLRHMSNGQEILGNPPPNFGRETITLGVKF